MNQFQNNEINGYTNKNNFHNNKEEQKEVDNSYSGEKEDLNEVLIKNKIYYSNRNNEINFRNPNKFINIKDGDIQLFQKFKNKHINMKNSNLKIKTKTDSENNKINNCDNKFNKTNHITNHINLNNPNSVKNMNSYINKYKPIRLNYNKKHQYNEILQQTCNKYNNKIKDEDEKENEFDSNQNCEQIQEKIDNLKNQFGFTGSNEEFIKYLEIIKIKSDLTHLVEILFNNGEKLNEEKAEECFNKLENLLEYKNNEEKNLLNGYQYLFEKLVKINNLNESDINTDI